MSTKRYQVDHWIRRNQDELGHYARAFAERIVPAFANLEEEAAEIRDQAYARIAAEATEWDDEASAREWAHGQGESFWIAMTTAKRGMVNLMVAGLYHLFEQHASRLLDGSGLPRLSNPPTSEYAADALKKYLRALGVDITRFKNWLSIDELRLVANTVKHGEGRSAEELKRSNPELFGRQLPSGLRGTSCGLPAMPLIGQGLQLTEEDFGRYRAALMRFWDELAEALVTVCGPAPPQGIG